MLSIPWQSWKYTVPFFLCCMGIALYGEYQAQENGTVHSRALPPLWDVVHTYLPDVSDYSYLNNVFALVVVIRLLSLEPQLQQYLFLIGVALACRSLSMIVTTQPTCTPQCFSTGGSFPWNTCYDYVYSGHTVSITISAICICKSVNAYRFERVMWAMYAPLCALWISASRQHYTTDVVLGLFIGTLLCI